MAALSMHGEARAAVTDLVSHGQRQ
jgi:hypothetical protein